MSDITPDTHFLESVRADRGSYSALLAEGVDNAFDAAATEILLTLTRDRIALQDNGVGITRDRELAIVKLGSHRSMPTTMLGRFGIGLKYHAVSAGDVMDVESVSSDGRMTLHADWRQVVRSGVWRIEDPKWMPVLRAPHTGTKITVQTLRWPSPTPKDIKTARETLTAIFYPALASQRRIVLNGDPLPILSEPQMRDVVEGDVRLENGKGAHVRGGITIDPASPLYHVQVSYRHRVIMPQSVFGCGEFTGTRRMFARVDLTGPWTLARFKDKLEDNDADELEDAVQDILRPVLEQCRRAQMSAQVNDMTTILNDMLPAELTPTRPPKKHEQHRKGRKRKEEPGKENQGSDTEGGPTRRVRSRQEVKISFDEPLVDEFGYGHFQEGKPGRIILALDNEHIQSLLEVRDKAVGARSLYAIALMLYQHELIQSAPQRALPGFNGSFGKLVWQLTKQQKIDDSAVA